MFLTSVIIILREVLEAALLVSLLSALSGTLGVTRSWVGWSVLFGMAGGIIYGISIDTISRLFDGMGQEITSASMQLTIYILISILIFLVLSRSSMCESSRRLIMLLMCTIVSLAVIREGFEIMVYIYGFSGVVEQLVPVLMGAIIGASIGISIGTLVYYLLRIIVRRWSLFLGLGLLTLVAAGMVSQAALLLIQADWLPSQIPLWDSSSLLSESSVVGQLLYALIGYEATPTPIQVSFYVCGLLIPLVLIFLARNSRKHAR